VDVAAPVLGQHHRVLHLIDAAEELALVVGQRGLLIVLLGPLFRVAHLGHIVLPGQTLRKPLRIQGNLQLSHIVLSSDRGATPPPFIHQTADDILPP
jgi:hypothetical protein